MSETVVRKSTREVLLEAVEMLAERAADGASQPHEALDCSQAAANLAGACASLMNCGIG